MLWGYKIEGADAAGLGCAEFPLRRMKTNHLEKS